MGRVDPSHRSRRDVVQDFEHIPNDVDVRPVEWVDTNVIGSPLTRPTPKVKLCSRESGSTPRLSITLPRGRESPLPWAARDKLNTRFPAASTSDGRSLTRTRPVLAASRRALLGAEIRRAACRCDVPADQSPRTAVPVVMFVLDRKQAGTREAMCRFL